MIDRRKYITATAVCFISLLGSLTAAQSRNPRSTRPVLEPSSECVIARLPSVEPPRPFPHKPPTGRILERISDWGTSGTHTSPPVVYEESALSNFLSSGGTEPWVAESPQPGNGVVVNGSAESVPAQPVLLAPWWDPLVTKPIRSAPRIDIDIDSVILATLQRSPRVRAIGKLQLIASTHIVEECADFDPVLFTESKLIRTSDPVGNLLDTGGPPRLREEDYGYDLGLRKKTLMGGSIEFSQRTGVENSNSEFFDPPRQGNARLSLSFNQPLLNGHGIAYNTSLIAIAEIQENVASHEVSKQLQDHLVKVARAFWALYRQRAICLQRKRQVVRAQTILNELRGRESVDASRIQILRAEAAVATRQADLDRADAEVLNAETQLRSLVGMPDEQRYAELVPAVAPNLQRIPIDLEDALASALANRPEIDQATQQVQAAAIRLEMSENELLPMLSAVAETYVAGLDGNYDIGQSFVDQFSVGEPGYTAGLLLEFPYGNQAARARFQRRELELRRIEDQLEDTVLNVRAEVEIAVRDVETAYRQLHGRQRAVMAAAAEVGQLSERLRLMAGEEEPASALLNFLLDAQDRLAVEELAMAQAQTDYVVAIVGVKRALGTLLGHEEYLAAPLTDCQMPAATGCEPVDSDNPVFQTGRNVIRRLPPT